MAHRTILSATGDVLKSVVTDEGTPDDLVFVTRQDLEPTLKRVAARREEKMSSDFKPVAEIPAVIVEQMMRDGSWNDPAAVRRWLNDPQNECFRIWQGRV
jgi:hypothetical protein